MSQEIQNAYERIKTLTAELETVKTERDQARREVCCMLSIQAHKDLGVVMGHCPVDYAKRKGWECYPIPRAVDETDDTSEEM